MPTVARTALPRLSLAVLLALCFALAPQAALCAQAARHILPLRAVSAGGAQSGPAPAPAPSAAYPPDTFGFQAVPGVETILTGWTEYSPRTCEVVDTGAGSVETQPAHGSIRFAVENYTVATECGNVTWPFTFAYYTWTDGTGTATEDFFSLRWATADRLYFLGSDWLAQSSVAAGKNLGVDCPACFDGNPVNAGTGNKLQVETDFAGGAASGLALARAYNSQDASASAFGAGWHSTWHRGLAVSGRTVTVTREDGRQDAFRAFSGAWAADPDVTSALAPEPATGPQTGWRLVRGDDSVELYTADGLLLSVATREGRLTTLAYNASGQLTTVTGPFGHQLAFAYDAAGHVRQMTAPGGQSYAYAYDGLGNLVSVTYPDGAVRQYVYENPAFPNALTGVVDELGNRFATYGYDSLGRATSTQHADGAELTTVAYNADGTSTVTDALGNAHTYALQTQFSRVKPAAVTGAPVPNAGAQAYAYDANGFVASRTDFNGNTTAYTRDARGLELSRTEAQGTPQARAVTTTWHPVFHLPTRTDEPSAVAGVSRATTFSYDPVQGTLLQKTVAAGGQSRTWKYAYNARGQPTAATDPNGNTTAYAYDAQGGLARATNALGQATTYAYDANGRLVSSTDPNGLATAIAYTARGQVASRTAGQEVTAYAYDLAGNLAKVTLPDGSFLAYAYNPAHQLTRVTDALGNHIDYTLDLAGNVTGEAVYDADGNLRRAASHAYDAANRLARDVGSVGQTTAYDRDTNGNVTAVTDPNGLKTASAYDALNRLAASTDPANGTTRIAYNADGSVAQATDPRGLATRYGYDGLGNQISVSSPDSGTATRTFDANGNVLTSTDARGKTTANTYDKLNRLTRQQFSDGYAAYTYDQGQNGVGRLTTLVDASGTTTWAYDPHGRVAQKRQKNGVPTLATTNTYDPASGKLVSTVLPSGRRLAYRYDPASGLPSGVDLDGQPLVRGVQYQPFGPVAAWIQGPGAALSHSRTFDLDGYLSAIGFANSAAPGSVESIGLTRDLGGRITQIADNTVPTKFFAYDALGQISRYDTAGASQAYQYDANGNRTRLDTAAGTVDYAIDPASNRLLARRAGGAVANYTLDAAGNLTGDGVRGYTVTGSDRLGNVKAGGATTAYAYNGLGERLVKKSAPSGAVTLFTQDQDGNVTGEYDGGGAPRQETVYLGGLPVAVIQPGAAYYVNPDHLGTPRTLTAGSGAPVWAWDRDPFGNGQPTASGAFAYGLRLPGQYYDPESGLFHNNARDYDPASGRYIQSDPVGLAGGVNTYAYAGNNPVDWVDPFGLADANPADPLNQGAFSIGSGGGGGGPLGGWGGFIRSTPSPALRGSPYNPQVVAGRIKPPYQSNPAHDPKSPLFNPRKTPEPSDVCSVYDSSVRGGMGTWYGKNSDGRIYRFFSDNAGTAHFSGIVPQSEVPYNVLQQLGF